MNQKYYIIENYHLSRIIVNNSENNEIRLNINGIDFLVRIPKSKVNLIYAIIKKEIEKKSKSILTLNEEILKFIEKLPSEKNKNGDARKSYWASQLFKMSETTFYQAKKVYIESSNEILQNVRSGKMSIKTAYRLISNKNKNIILEKK